LPELPEAETIVRTLGPLIAGQGIREAHFPGKRVVRAEMPGLGGRRIEGVTRYGKQILVQLDQGHLLVRLGMTGALLVNQPAGKFTRAAFRLSQATLHFDDIRQFGWIEYLDSPPEHAGPDPFEISAADFAQRVAGRRTEMKRLLLDQDFLRGIGNIYADEALFRAGIHPRASTVRLKWARAEQLHMRLVELLRESIACGGSSISDYVDATGSKGSFQLRHRVYGKQGEPCPQCGRPIERIVVAQRGTHFCPQCQRR
jgi:formamidopyrimidine-DNA glycosylase